MLSADPSYHNRDSLFIEVYVARQDLRDPVVPMVPTDLRVCQELMVCQDRMELPELQEREDLRVSLERLVCQESQVSGGPPLAHMLSSIP